MLSLASSPPLSSQVAAVNASLNPTALEFVPGKPSHDTPPAITNVEQASAPSFAQVCTWIERINNYFFYQALTKGEKKPNSDVRFPAVKVTTPPKGTHVTLYLTSCGILDSIYLVQGPPTELHSSDDEIVPSFQESFVDALAQATKNIQIASQGTKQQNV